VVKGLKQNPAGGLNDHLTIDLIEAQNRGHLGGGP
jgi:hypothetical protein